MTIRYVFLAISVLILAFVLGLIFISQQGIRTAQDWRTTTDHNGVWLYPQHEDIVAVEYGYYLPAFFINQIQYLTSEIDSPVYLYGNVFEEYATVTIPDMAYSNAVIVNSNSDGIEYEFPDSLFDVIVDGYSFGRIGFVSYVDRGTGIIAQEFMKIFDFKVNTEETF